MDLVFKIAPISDHVAKFRGDRQRNRRDLALNKKRKKEQQNIRAAVALSQRAALIRHSTCTEIILSDRLEQLRENLQITCALLFFLLCSLVDSAMDIILGIPGDYL